MPAHIAIIMDGNGRFAEGKGLPRLEGHKLGAQSVQSVTRECRRLGVKALTLYAFSAQNWSRPAAEVAGLMELLESYLVGEREELTGNDIRLQTIGQTEMLPDSVQEALAETKRLTEHCRSMTLTLALSYDSRQEIANAAQQLAMSGTKVTQASLSQMLSTATLPPVDLMIRTSGEQRISNFLLWELAYSELYFTETPWPEFREADLLTAIESYGARERRFGMTSAQIENEGKK